MPRQDKHEATTRMFKEWRDARPTVPVPFKYKAKGEGKIEQSWKDIHDKMNRDATSYALAFCTAHLAPSTAQANVLQELSLRDEKVAKKNREREEKLRQEELSQGRSIPGVHSLKNEREWLSDVERDVLRQSEGGGRGRVAFMKERNKLPLNVRHGLMARTSNMNYGWAQLNNDHYEDLKESCKKRQELEGTLLPDIKQSSSAIQRQRATVALQQRVPFVSEYVSADVARQSQIPPEYASLGARPNGSVPFALSVIGPAGGKGNKNADEQNASSSVIDGEQQQSIDLAAFSLGGEQKQGGSHRHARGDFRKRTFAASTRATGVFPGNEFV